MRGKVLTLIDFQFEFQDHPRLCGEKAEEEPPSAAKQGITPAYAGKSSRRATFFA